MEHAAKLKAARDALDGAETTAKLAANVRSAGYAPAVQLPLPFSRPPIVVRFSCAKEHVHQVHTSGLPHWALANPSCNEDNAGFQS